MFLFAYMMSNINNLIEKLDDDHVEILENKSEELDQWILKIDRANRDKKLESDFVEEIKAFFKNYWQKDHTMIQNEESFLNQMPRDLRSRVEEFIIYPESSSLSDICSKASLTNSVCSLKDWKKLLLMKLLST